MTLDLNHYNNTNYPLSVKEQLLKQPYTEEEAKQLRYHQFIAKEFFTKNKYARGLLICHGMGQGKTKLAVSIAEYFRNTDASRQVIVLLSKSLEGNFRNTVASYTNKDTSYIDENYKFISLNASNMFKQVSNIDKTKEEIEYEKRLADLTDKLTSSTLNNSLLIIDEAHNLFNAITNGAKNATNLYDMIIESKNLKIIFLTGTPIINDPFELVPCFNMLRGYIILDNTVLGADDDDGDDGSDADNNSEDNNEQVNERDDRHNNLNRSHSPRENKRFNKNDKSKKEFKKPKHKDRVLLFSESNDEFEEYFVDRVHKKIKNKDKFTNRIFGLSSYYGDLYFDSDILTNEDNFAKGITGGKKFRGANDQNIKKTSINDDKDIKKTRVGDDKDVEKTRVGDDKDIKKTRVGNDKDIKKTRVNDNVDDEKFDTNNKKDDEKSDTNNDDDEKSDINNKKDNKKLNDNNKKQDTNVVTKQGFPQKLPTIIEKVPMSDTQFARYIVARNQEIEEGKSKFRGKATRFSATSGGSTTYRVKSRQISNYCIPEYALGPVRGAKAREKFIHKITTTDLQDTDTYSPKMGKVLENINKNKGTLGMFYSQFVSGEGIAIFARILESNGWISYSADAPSEDEYGIKQKPRNIFAVLSGEIDPEERVNIIKRFNDPDNVNGKFINLLLMSGAVAEGIDLKRIRHVHILEPFWNYARINQVETRAIRYLSHTDLPLDQQNVQVYIYLSDYPAKYPLEKIKEPTTDVELYTKSIDNMKIINQFMLALAETSIDCSLHYPKLSDAIKPHIHCKLCAPTNEQLFHPLINRDMSIPSTCRDYQEKTVQVNEFIFSPTGETYYYKINPKDKTNIQLYFFNKKLNGYTNMPRSYPHYGVIYSGIYDKLNGEISIL